MFKIAFGNEIKENEEKIINGIHVHINLSNLENQL
jgi:hypothetical protein